MNWQKVMKLEKNLTWTTFLRLFMYRVIDFRTGDQSAKVASVNAPTKKKVSYLPICSIHPSFFHWPIIALATAFRFHLCVRTYMKIIKNWFIYQTKWQSCPQTSAVAEVSFLILIIQIGLQSADENLPKKGFQHKKKLENVFDNYCNCQ